MGWLIGPSVSLAERLGSGWVAFANALAAIGMTATLSVATRRIRERIVRTSA